MAWESRPRGTRYYTRSKRINGHVVREYIGSGPMAELMAQSDELERQQRAQERREWQSEKEGIEALEQELNALDAACRTLMHHELEAAGYHQHGRGEWRKRRKQNHDDCSEEATP